MKLFYDDNNKLYFTIHKKILTHSNDYLIRCFDKYGISVSWNDFNLVYFMLLLPCYLEISNEEIL